MRRERDGLVPARCACGCGTIVNVWGGPLMTTPDRPLATWGGLPMYASGCPAMAARDRMRRHDADTGVEPAS